MTRTLSAKGQTLMADLPPYYAASEATKAVVDPVARELARVEDTANDLLTKSFPQNADDTYGTLGIWEAQCGLPVAPAGITDDRRRDGVLARLRLRGKGAGANWVSAMSTQLGLSRSQWSYHEGPGDHTLVIVVPYGSGTSNATQALAFAKQITPANTTITVTYDQGFILGVSQLGSRAL